MIGVPDATHDASLRSWVETANTATTDFPIQNLPFGSFRRRGAAGDGSLGVAIGDRVLDLAACKRRGMLGAAAAPVEEVLDDTTLNRLMAAGNGPVRALRAALVELLAAGNAAAARRADEITVAMADVELLLPVRIGGYTDFYASIHHATNVGRILRPENPLLPNYKYVPVGYHGRASSVVVSTTAVRRPSGQIKDDAHAAPSVGPTRRLDYEGELGAFIGGTNGLGEPVPLARATERLWGVCLLNDWSARDIQAWEYQPLGPFLSKNFATSISPWVVTLDALAPFRAPLAARPPGDPEPLPYLSDADDYARGALALTLEVWLESAVMRERGLAAMRISRGSFTDMYWTLGQLVAHHTVGGCNLQPGDLIGSGTVSNAARESAGCLLERTVLGTEPLMLPSGERRAFLEDGDDVILRGYAERDGWHRVGLGECRGRVLPAT